MTFTVSDKVLRSIPRELVEIIIDFACDREKILIMSYYRKLKSYREKLDNIVYESDSDDEYSIKDHGYIYYYPYKYIKLEPMLKLDRFKKIKKKIKRLESTCTEVYGIIKAYTEGCYDTSDYYSLLEVLG